MRDINLLMPDVRAKARDFLDGLITAGIQYMVTSTLRTEAEQVALYAQGRGSFLEVNALRMAAGLDPIRETDNAYTVTNADGIRYKSNHQSGRALDVVPTDGLGNPVWPPGTDPRWAQIAKIGKSFGLSWGGDWPRFPDYPHWEVLA